MTSHAAHGAYQLQQQLAGVGHLQIQLAGGSDLQRHAGQRVDEPHLVRRAPLNGHLHRLVDEVDLTVESPLGVGGQLIELFQQGQLLCLQRVASRPEQIQCLSVPEEDGLLTFVDDKLRAEIEVLNGVLPHQCFVVALVLDDAGETILADALLHDLRGNIVVVVANRADEVCRRLGCTQSHAALAAGELRHLVLLVHGVDGLVADGTPSLITCGLVKDHRVAAVRALPGRHPVRADVDGVTAGAVDLFPGKEPGFALGKLATVGTFYYKFSHC